MRGIRTGRRAAPAALLGVALALALGACASSGGNASTPSKNDAAAGAQREPAAPAAAGDGRADTGGGAEQAGAGAQAGKADTAPQNGADRTGLTGASVPTDDPDTQITQRSIIYTGSITLRVKDVSAAAGAAASIAEGAGGTVSGDNRTIDAGRSQATVVLRVPSARFNQILDALRGGVDGKEESRSVSSEDVTDQIVDLDARVATAQASVDRVRALMARAQSLSEIVSLESELSRREASLNSLLQRRAKLADLADMSTITVVLLGPEAKVTKPEKDDTGFLAGLRTGWHAFTGSLMVLLTVVGALLPWLLGVGLPVLAAIAAARRVRRRRAPADAPQGAPDAPRGAAPPVPQAQEPLIPQAAQPE